MNILLPIFRFTIYSNIFVALCALSLCRISEIIMKTHNHEINQFVFFATLFTYNFQRLIKQDINKKSEKKIWVKRNKSIIIIISIISGLISGYLFLDLSLKTQIAIAFSGLICILYPIKLRNIPFVKIFLISIIWTISSCLLLILENNITITDYTILYIISVLLFVFAITIPFDIRDINIDDKKIKTIPMIFGIKKSKSISVCSLLITMIIYVYLFYKNQLYEPHLFSIFIALFITAILIIKSHENKNIMYFSFWIESTSLIFYLILYLSSWIV